jgi:hypothetical protein
METANPKELEPRNYLVVLRKRLAYHLSHLNSEQQKDFIKLVLAGKIKLA